MLQHNPAFCRVRVSPYYSHTMLAGVVGEASHTPKDNQVPRGTEGEKEALQRGYVERSARPEGTATC
jgi:hypothetical protein